MAQLPHTHEKHSDQTQRICRSQAHLTVPHFKSTTLKKMVTHYPSWLTYFDFTKILIHICH